METVSNRHPDWQQVFESGFSNAIFTAMRPPAKEDPDWDPEDVRYNVVRWTQRPSERHGPVIDPAAAR
jgi:hypothetical protein